MHEIGVLKTLGFSGATLLWLMLAESLIMLVAGGGVGLSIAWYIVEQAKVAVTPLFYLRTADVALGVVLMVAAGVLVGGVPALQARRITITEALGRN